MNFNFEINTDDINSSAVAVKYVSASRMRKDTKVRKIKDMLEHFSFFGKEEITLAEIVDVMQCRITQARWFEDKHRNKLYPEESYTTNGAPYPSTWNVEIWKNWIKDLT